MRLAEEFRDAFNADVGRARVVLLVSPTCEICLDGVRVVEESFSALASTDAALHVVWVGVLDADCEAAAEVQAASVSGRIESEHYWDGARQLSDRFRDVLGFELLERSVAWDLYLLFDRDATFGCEPPAPARWMHQLRIETAPELDGTLLIEELRRLLDKGTASIS